MTGQESIQREDPEVVAAGRVCEPSVPQVGK